MCETAPAKYSGASCFILKDRPWFWRIAAREILPSVHNRGYSDSCEQATADFKAQSLANIN
jgi:hypothetical protein